jgi:hypothetical protein
MLAAFDHERIYINCLSSAARPSTSASQMGIMFRASGAIGSWDVAWCQASFTDVSLALYHRRATGLRPGLSPIFVYQWLLLLSVLNV